MCNTSSMPVATREASVYTAITMAEYYRQMGLHVLLLADSTSRWAQALRERSGRLEEIPGEEAFPAYLESTIASFYERAGVVKMRDGSIGSVTIGGTVSPAGGNFEEPVTQSTLKVVGSFHGLSRQRSDARRYPAIDPLESWSRYTGIIDMKSRIKAVKLLSRANDVYQMMKVVGEEGITLEDYTEYLKGEFFDSVYLQQNAFDKVDESTAADRQKYIFDLIVEVIDNVYLQQDAFDKVDGATSEERQRKLFSLLQDIIDASLEIKNKENVRDFFNKMRQLFLDYNVSEWNSPGFQENERLILELFYKHKKEISDVSTISFNDISIESEMVTSNGK